MYKTISNKIIREFKPCYDPSKFIKDENEELAVKEWVNKYRKVIPTKDIFWLLLRKEFMSEKDLRLFAIWCAREALKLVENPDESIVDACNVAEKYANGEATMDELLAARDAAYTSVVADHTDHTDYAYYNDYYDYIASDAAAASIVASNEDAAHAARFASNYAVNAVAYAAQVDKLLTYFE
jgi:hypothetical protein